MAGNWQGREWQDYCLSLLKKRYAASSPHSLQVVPDAHIGDLGLEAFSYDGYAYQCYAAQEPLSLKERYEKQRDKLTTDLGKLRDKSADVHLLLGSVVIHRYVFLVHRHDSRFLISHAQMKSSDVLSWGLSFIAPKFCIVVETDDDYKSEREQLFAIPRPLIEPDPLAPDAVTEWVGENPGLRETAAAKLLRITASPGTVEEVIDALMNQFLLGENAMSHLKASVPDGYASVLQTKSQKESLLVLQHPPDQVGSSTQLTSIANELASELRSAYPLLDEGLSRTLAWSTVAEWLMRCPLNFGSPHD